MIKTYDFIVAWRETVRSVHRWAIEKGFWPEPELSPHHLTDATKIALIHSEVSEALEALRRDNPPDDKIPSFTGAEAELADAVIRIMDLAERRGWDVGAAIMEKMRYNIDRPFRHGKEF